MYRSIKTGQAGFVAGPSSAGKQTAPAASGISTGRSFSPAGPRPKTSPTALNTSPHRNENSPAAKSPLLGTAPPGLLPPPDKGALLYHALHQPTCTCMCINVHVHVPSNDDDLPLSQCTCTCTTCIYIHVHVQVHRNLAQFLSYIHMYYFRRYKPHCDIHVKLFSLTYIL